MLLIMTWITHCAGLPVNTASFGPMGKTIAENRIDEPRHHFMRALALAVLYSIGVHMAVRRFYDSTRTFMLTPNQSCAPAFAHLVCHPRMDWPQQRGCGEDARGSLKSGHKPMRPLQRVSGK
jgi:hypothetical protein